MAKPSSLSREYLSLCHCPLVVLQAESIGQVKGVVRLLSGSHSRGSLALVTESSSTMAEQFVELTKRVNFDSHLIIKQGIPIGIGVLGRNNIYRHNHCSDDGAFVLKTLIAEENDNWNRIIVSAGLYVAIKVTARSRLYVYCKLKLKNRLKIAAVVSAPLTWLFLES